MGLSMRELMTLDIVARDEASPVVSKVNSTVAASGLAYKQASIRALTYAKVLRGLSRGLTIYGGAAVAAAAFSGKAAMDYEHAMGLVRTQTDLSNKSFDKLEQGVLKLATKTSRPLDELTTSLYDIFSGIQVSGKGGLKMLTALAEASQAGNADMQTATRATLSELNAFGLGAKDVNMILDQQFQLLRKSTGTYEELTGAIGMVQPSALAAGQSLLQVNAALGFLTQRGFSFSEAATRASRAMDYLTRPTVAKGLHGIGVEVFDAQGNVRDLNKIVEDFGKRLEGLSEERKKHIFADIFGAGEVRANSFFNLATKGWRQYNKELKDVSKFHGALDKANAKVAKTSAVLWDKMKNQIRVVAIQIGNVLLPELNKFIQGISKLFKWFNQLDPSVKSTIAKFILWSGIIALITGRLAKLSAGLLNVTSMRLWSGAAADAAQAANAMGVAAGTSAPKVISFTKALFSTLGRFAIWGGLIAGVAYLIIKNWDKVKGWFDSFIGWWKDHWQQIWESVKPIVDFVVKAAKQLVTVLGGAFVAIAGAIGKFVGKMLLIKPVVQGVVTFLLVMIGVKLVQGILSALRVLVAGFIKFGAAIATFAKANWIALLIAALVTATVLIIKNWAKVKDFITKVLNGLARTAAQVGNWFIRFLVNPVIQGINTVIHAINGITFGLANISTIKPMQAIDIPDKFVSTLDKGKTAAGGLSDSMGGVAFNVQDAAGNFVTLNGLLDNFAGTADKAGKATKPLNKSVQEFNKHMADVVTSITKGNVKYADMNGFLENLMFTHKKLTPALAAEAQAVNRAIDVETKHLNTLLKGVKNGKDYAAVLANMGDVSLSTKSRFAELLNTVAGLGIKLTRNQKATIGAGLALHSLGGANKMLSGILKAASGDLDKANKGLDNLAKKHPKVKVDIDAKDMSGQVTEQGKKLDALGKRFVKPKLGLEDKEMHDKATAAEKKLRGLEKTKVSPKLGLNDAEFHTHVTTAEAALRRLEGANVDIPIDIHAATDPYAYGYAMGVQVAAGARAALQMKSPSKVFIKIGKDIIKGLVIGLRDAVQLKELKNQVLNIVGVLTQMPAMLSDTFKLLAKGTAASLNTATNNFQHFMDKVSNLQDMIGELRSKITDRIKEIQSKLKDLDKTINDKATKAAEKAKLILQKTKLSDELKKWMDVEGLPNRLSGVAKKLQSWGSDLQRRMQALNERVQSFTGDFRSGFQQGTDIVSILGGEDNRRKINIRKFFRDKIAEAKTWGRVLRELARKGLDENLLQELAAAGPAALPLARQILDVGVKFVNKQQGQLNQIAGATEKYLVNTVFGKQIDQLATEAKKFHDVLKELVDAIKEAVKTTNDGNGLKRANNGSGNGNNTLVYHYHAPARADAREQVRELGWWWRQHRYGA